MKWALIPFTENHPYLNMAIDEALYRLAGSRSETIMARLYGWQPPALSIGRHQPFPVYQAAPDLTVVRRITGGKSVYHDHELTYSLIFPHHSGTLAGDLLRSYELIAGALIQTLASFGLDAAYHEQDTRFASFRDQPVSCFALPGPYEIVVNGKKIIGSAQCRNHRFALQHGSILLDLDEAAYATLFTKEPQAHNITTIRAETGTALSLANLSQSLITAFSALFDCDPVIHELTADEQRLASLLAIEKYGSMRWLLEACDPMCDKNAER